MTKGRITVLGANGQLGRAIRTELSAHGHEIAALTRREFEIERDSVEKLDDFGSQDYIINCAAFHKVDQCETDPRRAFDINCRFVHDLSLFCNARSATLIHFSTDYVFDGLAKEPYIEQAKPGPSNLYGISKLAGENAAEAYAERFFVLRVSSLFGPNVPENGTQNFVDKIIAQAAAGKRLRVITDQIMSPTFSLDTARAVRALIESGENNYGLYHACNSGFCSWYEFAREIVDVFGWQVEIEQVSSAEFYSDVKRPKYSALDNRKLSSIYPMPHWKEALAEYVSLKQGEGIRKGE